MIYILEISKKTAKELAVIFSISNCTKCQVFGVLNCTK